MPTSSPVRRPPPGERGTTGGGAPGCQALVGGANGGPLPGGGACHPVDGSPAAGGVLG
jgi:hypothetical protein